jgi:molybdopterin/thiamine biosynthesis adenylyltransferase
VSSAVLGSGVLVQPAAPRLVLAGLGRPGALVDSPPVQRHILLSVFLI